MNDLGNEATKSRATSLNNKYKKQLGVVFNQLPEDVKASSRRIQFFGDLVLKSMMENSLYSTNPLCTKLGASALKNALKFYNIGVASLSEALIAQMNMGDHTATDAYRDHVAHGGTALHNIVDFYSLEDSFYWDVLNDVLAQHHEKWDGTGYPAGLGGGQICLAARICSVCDYFDMLTTSTDDRDKMTVEAAFEEVQKRADVFFDPVVVEGLGYSLDKINQSIENGALAKASSGQKNLRAIEQLYRPVYDYSNRLTYGYETDLRLNDKELGVIKSDVFLPVAESSSKINELVKWSVEEACETMAALRKRGRFTGMFFLRMSVKSLVRKHFIENITRIVKGYELSPEDFCFVIPENMLTMDMDKISEGIAKLRAVGFSVAIGGFGTEYSNLAGFQSLEVDYIMLGEEFVSGILTSIRSKKIAESIVELANRLDTLVIADGVATKEQAEALFGMGCGLMRGTRFGRYSDAASV